MTHHQDKKRFFFVFVLRLTATFTALRLIPLRPSHLFLPSWK